MQFTKWTSQIAEMFCFSAFQILKRLNSLRRIHWCNDDDNGGGGGDDDVDDDDADDDHHHHCSIINILAGVCCVRSGGDLGF